MATKEKEKGPTGYTCMNCKKFHAFAHYVYAHWRDSLVHTCSCGAKHQILEGQATRIG